MSDDIVAELDRWLDEWRSVLSLRELSMLVADIDFVFVQRARDEIVRLRAEHDTQ